MKKLFVSFVLVNLVLNFNTNFYNFKPYQEYTKNNAISLPYNSSNTFLNKKEKKSTVNQGNRKINCALGADRLIDTNLVPALMTIIFSIVIILKLLFWFTKLNKSIITFKDNENPTYLTNTKQDYYSKGATLLKKGKIVDVKYISHYKNRPLLSKLCFHFNTKKFVPIKEFEISVKRVDKKDYKLVSIKNYNPYDVKEEAVIRKWGIVYYDPYVEITLQEFLHKKSKIIEKYEYAKGFESKLSCENIIVSFKFANGSEEGFNFHVNDDDMKDQIEVHYKLERISITKEGKLIFPYYQEFMRDCAMMYMYNQELWMKTVNELYEILTQEKNFTLLVESQSDEQDELTCFSEFMYDRKASKDIKNYVSTIINKYYLDTSKMGFRKKNIIEEIKLKINDK